MKKILVATLLVLFSFSMVLAEWLVDFSKIYVEEGIDKAVENALKEGIAPDLIVEKGLDLDGLNPQNLIKALYCAGVVGQDIREAAEKWEISQTIVAAGFKKAKAECGDQVADAQAYTDGEQGPSFSTPRRTRTRNGWDKASPSQF